MERDLYDVLGVPRTASEEQIRHAYWSLAKKYHPDVSHGDPDAGRKFIEAQEAADTLLDPARRAAYDRSRPAGTRAGTPGAARPAAARPAPAWATGARPAASYSWATAARPAAPSSPPRWAATRRVNLIVRGVITAALVVGLGVAFAFGISHPEQGNAGDIPNGTVVWRAANYPLIDGWGINLAGHGRRIQLVPGTTADLMDSGGYLSAGGHIATLPLGDAATYQHCVSAVEQSGSQSVPLIDLMFGSGGLGTPETLCASGGGGDLASIQVIHDDDSDLTVNITVWEYV